MSTGLSPIDRSNFDRLLLLVVLVLTLQTTAYSQNPPLDPEQVRIDILASTEEEFPDGPTEIADRSIEIFQLADCTLANVQYKVEQVVKKMIIDEQDEKTDL